MATLTGTHAVSTYPVSGAAVPTGVLQVAWGIYTLAANPSQNDVIECCKLPKGATVIGGWLAGADIDTGTETFDIDVGYADDTDAFGNLGVVTGDVSVPL